MRIDLGCGTNKKDGFLGCDFIPFTGVDYVFDIGKARWHFEDGSVEEAYAAHFLEHLDSKERAHFANQLYRVLAPEAICTIIVPHWCSQFAYGDPTHKWPPISETWPSYLNRNWRMVNAPHTDKEHWADGYECDFGFTLFYSVHPNIKDDQVALAHYRDAAFELRMELKKQ